MTPPFSKFIADASTPPSSEELHCVNYTEFRGFCSFSIAYARFTGRKAAQQLPYESIDRTQKMRPLSARLLSDQLAYTHGCNHRRDRAWRTKKEQPATTRKEIQERRLSFVEGVITHRESGLFSSAVSNVFFPTEREKGASPLQVAQARCRSAVAEASAIRSLPGV